MANLRRVLHIRGSVATLIVTCQRVRVEGGSALAMHHQAAKYRGPRDSIRTVCVVSLVLLQPLSMVKLCWPATGAPSHRFGTQLPGKRAGCRGSTSVL